MRTRRFPSICAWAILIPAAGCGSAPAPPAGTGAREKAQGYYEALLRRDWPGAYAALHADSRAQCSQAQFAHLAEHYLDELGPEPRLQVRSCDEHGNQAIVHVAFAGQASGKQRVYKDGVILLRSEGEWKIVLSAKFGRSRTP
jgi:hypothetical protein